MDSEGEDLIEESREFHRRIVEGKKDLEKELHGTGKNRKEVVRVIGANGVGRAGVFMGIEEQGK